MTLSDDLLNRIDLALRQAQVVTREPSPAAKEAGGVREKARLAAAKKLARLFARSLSENAGLRAELRKAMQAAPAAPAESELELGESRETVVNLMLQLSRERRRWKAALLSVRRRLKSARPSARRAGKRLEELELELAESQETAAKLLVELTRKSRSSEAAQRLGRRARRRSSGEDQNRGYAVAPAVAAAATRFEEGLRAVIESPAMDPEAMSQVARQGMALTRTLRLAAEISDGQPAALEPGQLIHERLERCLDQWEAEAGRRRLNVVRRIDKTLPAAVIPLEGIESVLDEIIGGAIARAPRGTVVIAAAGAAEVGGLSISIQTAASGSASSTSALETLAFALSRELVERWNGKLVTAEAPGARGLRTTLLLAASESGS